MSFSSSNLFFFKNTLDFLFFLPGKKNNKKGKLKKIKQKRRKRKRKQHPDKPKPAPGPPQCPVSAWKMQCLSCCLKKIK